VTRGEERTISAKRQHPSGVLVSRPTLLIDIDFAEVQALTGKGISRFLYGRLVLAMR
jgi:hypothetical protein